MIEFFQRLFKLGDYSTERTFGGVPRSPEWPKFKADFEKTHPKICSVCGGTDNVQLHHIQPYHTDVSMELDVTNVTWLCTGNKTINCHLRFGHFDNFMTKWNPNIKIEAPFWNARFIAKTQAEIPVDNTTCPTDTK